MLKFVIGGAGCGKSVSLMNIISETAETDKKVIFIVPEQFSFEADKKIYKALGVKKFNRILSLSFTSLAREIFELYGGRSGEYAEDIHKYIFMNRAIKDISKRGDLRFYGKQSKKISFVGEALKIINEFKQCGISPEELENASCSAKGASEKLIDLSMIYAEYDGLLKAHDLKDSLSDISEAAAVANMNDYFKGKVVVFDEFESFTGDELELIDSAVSQAADVYFALRLESTDIHEQNGGVFDSVLKTYHKLHNIAKKYNIPCSVEKLEGTKKYKGNDLAFLNKNVLRSKDRMENQSENIEIVRCRDLYEEANFVAAKINELVRVNNYKYGDIAVISRQLDEYVFILEAAFRRYDIPCFMDVKKSAYHTLIMQLMLNTVNVVCSEKPETEDILKYIKTSFCKYSIDQISKLENYCFEWGIKGSDWFRPFEKGIDQDPEPEEMRSYIIAPVKKCRDRCKKADSGEVCKAIYQLFFDMKIPLRVADLIDDLMASGYIFEGKEQKRMWDTMMDILDTFEKIGSDIPKNEFTELLASVLQNMTYALPPQKLDTVHAARAETARLNSPKAVFVLGANEGYFPKAVAQSGLLSDKDRLRLREANLTLSRDSEELVSDERLVVYKSLTHASEKLFITYPETDSAGKVRFTASVVKSVADMFGEKILSTGADKGPSFYCSTPSAAFYYYVQNYGKKDAGIKEIETALYKDSIYARKIDFLRRLSDNKSFTVGDKELLEKLFTKRLTLSPTGFESFNMCHFMYFCDKGLNIRPLKKRTMDALEQGNIVHSCLETILSSCKTKEQLEALTEENITKIVENNVNSFVEENLESKYSASLRNCKNITEIKKSIVSIARHLQEELGQSDFRPVEFEYVINQKRLPILRTSDGVEIILNGKIDRVDIYENDKKEKYVRIIDYKSGKKDFSIAELKYGINMQMLIYLFSITEKGEKYSDFKPAGVLYMPSREIECARDRDDSKDIEDFIRSNYRMKGLVLNERSVLQAMEKDIRGVYIPAKALKGDTGSGEVSLDSRASSCFSSAQFSKLRDYIGIKMNELAEELYSGRIEAEPLELPGREACAWCNYHNICGHEQGDSSRVMEGTPREIREEFIRMLSEDEEIKTSEDFFEK